MDPYHNQHMASQPQDGMYAPSQPGHRQTQSQDSRPQTSYSDTGFHPYNAQAAEAQQQQQHNLPLASPSLDAEPTPRYASTASQPSSRPPSQTSHTASGSGPTAASSNKPNNVVIKVGMVGDAQIGKTSLMVKYVEGSWDEDYIQTLGVNFMEKTISIRNTEITFSIWDLGGQREFVNMLPLVCNDAVAILFMFDLTRKSTLNSIKEWYRQGRGFNKTAIPFLVGTKYDHFINFPKEEQEEISTQVLSSCVKSVYQEVMEADRSDDYRHDDSQKL